MRGHLGDGDFAFFFYPHSSRPSVFFSSKTALNSSYKRVTDIIILYRWWSAKKNHQTYAANVTVEQMAVSNELGKRKKINGTHGNALKGVFFCGFIH